MVAGAVRSLVEDSDARILGLLGPRGRNFCGQLVDLSPSELEAAILTDPWSPSRAAPVVPLTVPVAKPNGGNVETPVLPLSAGPPPVESDELGTPPSPPFGGFRQQIGGGLKCLEKHY